MIVCVCRAVSDRHIRKLVDAGAESMAEVRAACGIGECCGKCARQARELIAGHLTELVVREAARVDPVHDASRFMKVC